MVDAPNSTVCNPRLNPDTFGAVSTHVPASSASIMEPQWRIEDVDGVPSYTIDWPLADDVEVNELIEIAVPTPDGQSHTFSVPEGHKRGADVRVRVPIEERVPSTDEPGQP
eukprot:2583427-Prymnesium_polylepis.1